MTRIFQRTKTRPRYRQVIGTRTFRRFHEVLPKILRVVVCLRVFLIAVGLIAVGASKAPAQPGSYTFAQRADTAGPISGFFFPAIGADGSVAFRGELDAGGLAIYTVAPNGPLVQKATTGTQFSFLDQIPAINVGGTTVFSANLTTGGSEIHTAAPSGLLTLVATTQTGGGFSGFDRPSINAVGTVAFVGFRGTGINSVYTASPGGSPVAVASPDGSVTSFARQVPINADGTLAYIAFFGGVGHGIYRLAPGGSPVQVANTLGPFSDIVNNGGVALNDSGTIGFVTSLDAGGKGLYTVALGGSPVQIANTAGPFRDLGAPSINAAGVLTYSADLDTGGRELYVLQPGGMPTRLIGDGDPLDGSTVTGIIFPSSQLVLNDAGQIAFAASLADGRRSIFVATREPTQSGDFNGDGVFDCVDVDTLVAVIADASQILSFDMNGDNLVNGDDLNAWLSVAGAVNLPSGNPYLPGDANLDGDVADSDFGIWNSSKFTNVAAWCNGDFNADGAVDGSDFGIWNANKFTSADSTLVPEPGRMMFVLVASIALSRGTRYLSPMFIASGSTLTCPP